MKNKIKKEKRLSLIEIVLLIIATLFMFVGLGFLIYALKLRFIG